jgi:hypothetical protein
MPAILTTTRSMRSWEATSRILGGRADSQDLMDLVVSVAAKG